MSAKNKQPKFQSPSFKVGDYVPLALLIVSGGDKVVNFHLPQKLFAIKDFKQSDMMTHYFFQHPQQPVYLNEQNPQIGEFNSAVVNLHKWMILNGYARQEGTTNVTARVWSQEEVDAARAEVKARRDAQILAHAEAMAAAGDEGMNISQGINNLLGAADNLREVGTNLYAEGSLDKLEHEPVNVGTIGHVDHGVSGVARALGRIADGGVRIDVDPADPEPETTRRFIEHELVAQRSVSDGGQAFERSIPSADEPEAFLVQGRPVHELDRLLVDTVPGEIVRSAPQYPLPVAAAE